MTLIEVLKLIWPLLVIELGIRVYCIVLIWHNGVRNLNQWAWTAIIAIVNLFGWVGFLTLGRKSA